MLNKIEIMKHKANLDFKTCEHINNLLNRCNENKISTNKHIIDLDNFQMIPGPKGEQGEPGVKGEPGVQGEPGKDNSELLANLRNYTQFMFGSYLPYSVKDDDTKNEVSVVSEQSQVLISKKNYWLYPGSSGTNNLTLSEQNKRILVPPTCSISFGKCITFNYISYRFTNLMINEDQSNQGWCVGRELKDDMSGIKFRFGIYTNVDIGLDRKPELNEENLVAFTNIISGDGNKSSDFGCLQLFGITDKEPIKLRLNAGDSLSCSLIVEEDRYPQNGWSSPEKSTDYQKYPPLESYLSISIPVEIIETECKQFS